MKVGVEVALVAGELCILKTEINVLLPGARRDAAVRLLEVPLAAALTLCFAELS